MNIIVMKPEQIRKYVGDRFQAQLKEIPHSVLGMTTGSSPLKFGIYDEFIKRGQAGNMDFSEAAIVNPDELLGIPQDHPETYRTYMKEHLFNDINVNPLNTHIPDSDPENPEDECKKFDELIDKLGGVDLQLMGLGENGHIAFMEPKEAIPASTYVVDLEEQNRPAADAFADGLEVPKQAITVGLRYVMKARAIIVVAIGASKASIVKEAFTGPVTTKVPATFLQLHPNVTIILDEESAKELPEELYQVL